MRRVSFQSQSKSVQIHNKGILICASTVCVRRPLGAPLQSMAVFEVDEQNDTSTETDARALLQVEEEE